MLTNEDCARLAVYGCEDCNLALNAYLEVKKENERLRQRVNELLSEELTDGAVRERIQLRFNMHEVLQENEKLQKMCGWLAQRFAEHCNNSDSCGVEMCPSEMWCNAATKEKWIEAARRAIAETKK